MSKDFLRRLPLFAKLKESDLDQLYEGAKQLHVPDGQLLIEEGTAGDCMFVILGGEFEVYRTDNGRQISITRRGAGEILGEMALLEGVPRGASVRAIADSEVLAISKAGFEHLLACSFSAVMAILKTVTGRVRMMEQVLVQQDKLAALGTMAAGLAHELNNPAAAAHRSAEHLRKFLTDWHSLTLQLDDLQLHKSQRERLRELQERLATRDSSILVLDSLERSDREEEMQTWLEDRGIDDAWELAPTLVNSGWTTAELGDLLYGFSDTEGPLLVRWIVAGTATYMLLEEVSVSTGRIAELVKSVKTYTFLDQAPVQEVDVEEGIESTLVMMRYKLKHGITLLRDYAPNLPHIEAYGSELNQVWTNIIDNAVDAMNGQGEIRIKTYAAEDQVVVEIRDNGPGIPPDIQKRIFEPFFTTKGPGSGTGLGLHIAYNIVAGKHRGEISVLSEPGFTCFQIRLPLRLKREAQPVKVASGAKAS